MINSCLFTENMAKTVNRKAHLLISQSVDILFCFIFIREIFDYFIELTRYSKEFSTNLHLLSFRSEGRREGRQKRQLAEIPIHSIPALKN